MKQFIIILFMLQPFLLYAEEFDQSELDKVAEQTNAVLSAGISLFSSL